MGYTTLAFALALPSDGKVYALDISEEYVSYAKPYWQKAGVADKIDLKLKPASDTLQEFLDQNQAGTFDFCYIDADKNVSSI